MTEIATQIKSSLTAKQVVEYYGFTVKQNGFISCPFHTGDKTASLKLYDGTGGWHCFGCQRSGSVIDFVMELNGIGFVDACRNLDAAFHLNLFKESTFKERRQAIRERERRIEKQKQEKAANEYSWKQYSVLCQYRRFLARQTQTPFVQFDIEFIDRLLDLHLEPEHLITFDASALVNALLSKHPNRGDYDLHSGDY